MDPDPPHGAFIVTRPETYLCSFGRFDVYQEEKPMNNYSLLYPEPYADWVKAGGIEHNFLAHLLATGIRTCTPADYAWMLAHTETANKQFNQLVAWLHGTIEPDPVIKPRTGVAADISYLTGDIDDDFCDVLSAMRVDTVIVGLQDLALANRQLNVLVAHEFNLQAYIWPQNKTLSVYLPLVEGILYRYGMPIVWVDVEDRGDNCAESIDLLSDDPNYKVGVYTSPWMWKTLMANTTRFSHVPLWYARYDNVANMTAFEPFAGWTRPTAKQYNADDPRYDLNVYDPELMP